ncbi:MAG: hypothetical protein O3A46_17570, partial [Candidatus Poribacteria bacterium]|nr:hypothetical protein [Candidatus Poribacteria bacterium]
MTHTRPRPLEECLSVNIEFRANFPKNGAESPRRFPLSNPNNLKKNKWTKKMKIMKFNHWTYQIHEIQSKRIRESP